jgi:mRNA-degrading endonuclease RelE of RelBE toxin-antitoxin system
MYSKCFNKDFHNQSGKDKELVLEVIRKVKQVETLYNITDCKRVLSLKTIYRIRVNDLRVFFSFRVTDEIGSIYFISILRRGQAYDKKNMQALKRFD